MFYGCTSLTTAPGLPATTLASNCYANMFYGCTGLTTAPSSIGNSATIMSSSACCGMFSNCTSLTTVPALPATTLAEDCYLAMFQYCTSLTEAPELPATTLADSCYNLMFRDCTSLTTAPELPATTLVEGCYSSMFRGCTSLTEAPELPATTLEDSCYNLMFRDCTSLTTAPELPATTLVEGCYYYMFYGCSSLNYIKCLATNISATDCTTNWVNGVASAGTFVKADNFTGWTTGVNGIPTNWVTKTEIEVPLTFKILSAGTIVWLASGTTPSPKTIQYSINGGNWTNITSSTAGTVFNVAAGDRVEFKGDNDWYASGGSSQIAYNTFWRSTAVYNVKGNIMSLINSTDFATAKTLTKYCTFASLFWYSKVVDAYELLLPATTLTTYCYDRMFQSCSLLERGPRVLPAETLTNAVYRLMFFSCPKITESPVLCATTLASNCYESMFRASGLITAPELTAETVPYCCYRYMFSGCTNLITPPTVLPATHVEYMAYYSMFAGDVNMLSAPEILAESVESYSFSYMFYRCRKLDYVKCMTKERSDETSTLNWLLDVASAGTLERNPDMHDWEINSPNGIPSGWTVIDDNVTSPLTFDVLSNGEIRWTSVVSGTSSVTRTIEYNKNNAGWTSITPIVDTGASISVSTGDVVQFRGKNAQYSTYPNVYNGFKNS